MRGTEGKSWIEGVPFQAEEGKPICQPSVLQPFSFCQSLSWPPRQIALHIPKFLSLLLCHLKRDNDSPGL